MGLRRKNDVRGCKTHAQDIVYFVRSLFKGLDTGMVQWPKHINGFVGVIQRAYAGKLDQLATLLDKISRRGDNVQFRENDSDILIKWKRGINGKYLAEYTTLKLWYDLLKEYHRLKNGKANAVSAITIGTDSEQLNQVISDAREAYSHYNQYAKRTEL